MELTHKLEAGNATIKLSGRFDYNSLREFAYVYKELAEMKANSLTIDLSSVDYIDSSALGELIRMHGLYEERGIVISLSGVRGLVKSVIDAVNFKLLFQMK
jgi:HptB-dependent secretion and biofilm anti anti-sigma factor